MPITNRFATEQYVINEIQTVNGGQGGSSLNWRGEWSELETYKYQDVVTYNGSAYIYNDPDDNAPQGTTPGEGGTSVWSLFVSKGDTGATGASGTSVTVKSVSTSTADGGSNVVTFSDNKTLTVKNGSTGATGAAGVGIKSVTQTTTSSADGGSNVITVTKTDNTTSTFTVKNGSKGSKGDKGDTGAAGTSVTHSWNGTTLTVTSASGTSSADLKGEKGDAADAPVQSVNSKTGTVVLSATDVGAEASGAVTTHNEDTSAHADIREEIAEVSSRIVSEVMTMTEEEYNSLTKTQFAALYANGVRIIAVEVSSTGDSSGSTSVINQVMISIDADGNIYNGTGYKTGYRLNSSGSETASTYDVVTGYISASAGDTIRIDVTEEFITSLGNVVEWHMDANHYICAYDANFNYICGCTPQSGGTAYGGQQLWTSMGLVDGVSVVTLADISNIAYIRVSINGMYKNGAVQGSALLVTVDSDKSESTTTTYTNQVPISIDAEGNTYSGTGYRKGYRLNSSGTDTEVLESNQCIQTGYIPASGGDVIRIDTTVDIFDGGGVLVDWYRTTWNNYICAYDSNFNYISGCTPQNGGTAYGDYKIWSSMELVDGVSIITLANIAEIAYIRISLNGFYTTDYDTDTGIHPIADGSELIVTVNEEI